MTRFRADVTLATWGECVVTTVDLVDGILLQGAEQQPLEMRMQVGFRLLDCE